MGDSKNLNSPVVIGIVVALVLIVGYILWARSAPPAPELGAGQSIQNPMGTAAPNAGRGAGGGQMPRGIPAPGTVDPVRGFGPSKNAPISR